jgi:hypothetical protein
MARMVWTSPSAMSSETIQDEPPIVAEEHRPGLPVDLGQPHPLGAQELKPRSEPEQ